MGRKQSREKKSSSGKWQDSTTKKITASFGRRDVAAAAVGEERRVADAAVVVDEDIGRRRHLEVLVRRRRRRRLTAAAIDDALVLQDPVQRSDRLVRHGPEIRKRNTSKKQNPANLIELRCSNRRWRLGDFFVFLLNPCILSLLRLNMQG